MKQGNNYKVGNFETSITMAMVILIFRLQSWYIIRNDDKRKKQSALLISTFLSMIVDKKAAYSHNQLHIVTSPDIWHRKMGYIGLLKLYKVEKECLRVKLWGKKMS